MAVTPTSVVPLIRKSIGGMNFTQVEADHMMDFYDIMAEVDEKRGVNAWARYSVEVRPTK